MPEVHYVANSDLADVANVSRGLKTETYDREPNQPPKRDNSYDAVTEGMRKKGKS